MGLVVIKQSSMIKRCRAEVFVGPGLWPVAASRDNGRVKPTRLPLVQFWKQSTGGTSGLHRAA